jgi:hypothetical protein
MGDISPIEFRLPRRAPQVTWSKATCGVADWNHIASSRIPHLNFIVRVGEGKGSMERLLAVAHLCPVASWWTRNIVFAVEPDKLCLRS